MWQDSPSIFILHQLDILKHFFPQLFPSFKKKNKPQTKHLTIIRGNKFLVHVMKVCLHLKKWTFNSSVNVNAILFNYNPLMIV